MRTLEPGDEIGAYRITKFIAHGGMGLVYKGVDQRSDGEIACKILRSDVEVDAHLQERFRREIMIMQTLQHPNIVPLVDFGEFEGSLYLIMPFIHGITLGTWFQSAFFSLADVMPIAGALCRALGHAHRHGVLHRDVKPGNVMVDTTLMPHHIYLADFGLSKISGMLTLTETQMTVGTPDYMSPEQVEDRPLTPASDLYALTIILYELLLRQLPYDADTDLDKLVAHVERQPIPPSALVADFPPGFEAILLRGLSKDPAARYDSAEAMLEALQEAFAWLSPAEQTRVMRYT